MANTVLDKGFTPTAAVPIFTAVKLDTTTNQSVSPAGASDTAAFIGICQEEVVAGDANKRVVNIRLQGISRAVASAAIAIGDKVKLAANGRMVTTTTVDDFIAGTAFTAAAAAGDHFDMELQPGIQL